jgi:branched-chain amino acid transport system permease protein
MSLPSWRFKGDIFIIATIAVQSMTFSILYNWRSVTNGPYGLSGIPRPDLFGRTLDRPWEMTALALVLALICGLILFLLLNSPGAACCRRASG